MRNHTLQLIRFLRESTVQGRFQGLPEVTEKRDNKP